VAAGGELGLDRELDGTQVKLLQPPDLGRGERLLGDIGERRAAPELQRALDGAVADPLLGLSSCPFDEALESRGVNRALWKPEFVAPTSGGDLRLGVGAGGGQGLPQT